MNLELDSAGTLLRETADRFFASLSRTGQSERATWAAMSDLGWTSVVLPEESGGSGSNLIHLGVLIEAFGRHAVASPFLDTVCTGLLASGAEPAPAEFVSTILQGDRIALLAPLLPERRPWLASQGRAARLTVPPTVVPWAGDVDAVAFLAATAEFPVLVVLKVADMEGALIRVRTFDAVPASIIELDSLVLPSHATVVPLTSAATNGSVALLATLRIAQILGAAEFMLDSAIEYVKARRQFGRSLGEFQVVQHSAADMAIALDATRLLVNEVLSLATSGRPFIRSAAAVVIHGAAACEQVSLACSQLHGGTGFMKESGLDRYYTRIKAEQIRIGARADVFQWAAPLLLDRSVGRQPYPEIGATPRTLTAFLIET